MTQLGLFPLAGEVTPASQWCQRWSGGLERSLAEAKAALAHSHPCIECHEPTPCTSQRDHRTPMCEACKADDADVWGRTSV